MQTDRAAHLPNRLTPKGDKNVTSLLPRFKYLDLIPDSRQ